ncbi:MAG: adenine nucleotide alpha hydrolase family protein [Nitrospirota bacterium]|nr:adenine nucleotide alpha hydrolase family protein [Nitrospirota bacterium]
MRCRKCPKRAVLGMPRHNTAFCATCLTEFVRTQVQRAIKAQHMFSTDDRILVAVSGGKDSLTLWEILLKLGYRADALYVDLGIPGYSGRSKEKVEQFAREVAEPCGAQLTIHTVEEDAGAGIKELANLIKRPTCSACGTIKRYQFNRVAWQHHYDVMATGHNLDDEAARLLGNVLQWQEAYLQKQSPSLPASVEGFAKKVKPLYRMTEREIAAYAVVNRIDYLVEECPMAKGAKMLVYKDALNRLEAESPGTKQRFYWGFLDKQEKAASMSPSMSDLDQTTLHPCIVCSQPTTAGTCSFCRMMARAKTPAK